MRWFLLRNYIIYIVCLGFYIVFVGKEVKMFFGGWGFSVRWVLHIVRGIILCGWL